MNNEKSLPVVICIGTPKVPGDSLGPKVGDLLVKKYRVKAYVYGKTRAPVTGVNCPMYFAHLRAHHKKSIVIAVDACLGSKEDVGKVKITYDGLRAGSALKKDLGKVGDLSFLGMVGEKSDDNMAALMSADSAEVDALAEKIAEKIHFLAQNIDAAKVR